jgi:CrcB protein
VTRLRWDVVGVVFAGGCVGGCVRFLTTTRWPAAAGGFPWSTWTVNVLGAFVLAVVVVTAADLAPSRYLRPLVGTGFCGALTTFSSVVVAADQLFGRHPGTAVAYLVASIAGGLAAAAAGLWAARFAVSRYAGDPVGRSGR